MPPDEDDPQESFADLIGETRPLKSGKEVVSPVSTGPNSGARPSRATTRRGEDAAGADRFRWPDADQPRFAATHGVSNRQLRGLQAGQPAPEERIDLHGVRADAAGRLLDRRFESAVARGLRCVLVIHGKGSSGTDGDSILRERLPNWLTKSPAAKNVLAFAPAPRNLGAEGATLVLLKKPR
jgi:DNA-nicking Smr family endonuclease